MRTRTKVSRRSVLIAFGALVLIMVTAGFVHFAQPKTPHVTAVFLNFADTLRPRHAQFAITNHSSRLVHLIGYRFVIDSRDVPCQAQTISPRESSVVTLDIAEPLAAHSHLELLFRRQDTPIEEGREMLDSVLRSIGIRWPGLNPDSSANRFYISSRVPARPILPE